MINQVYLEKLVSLVKQNIITVDQIKDPLYKEEVIRLISTT